MGNGTEILKIPAKEIFESPQLKNGLFELITKLNLIL